MGGLSGNVVLLSPDQYTLFENGDIVLCPAEHPLDLYYIYSDSYFGEVVEGKLSPSRITPKFFFQKWDAEDDYRHYLFRPDSELISI